MFISPFLLETSKSAFDSPDHIFEPKIDGHRLLLSRPNGQTHLYTRQNNECTQQYPELYDIAQDDILLDSEVACVDRDSSLIDFESVMERFSPRKADKVLGLSAAQPANYIVFDILRYKGEDLRGWPLMKRKELLAGIDFGNPRISVVPYIEREGERLYQEIVSRQMEGNVAKRKESIYVSDQKSLSWLKIINWTYVDVVLTGWRKDEFGWLVGVQAGERIRPAGVVELGVTAPQRKAFYAAIQPYVTGEDKHYVYVQPLIKAKVKIRNWTKKGLLRSPVFVKFAT
ncbi:ATP-dependent DNA ligase [Paenibacillus hemerocallicola]|uniref:ATP-dependent DNA ligase n=1 Tax=Paenibacillus hemerocallicola TaxID=1172614 RepID=A0A5C4T1V4_9BACL|nr:ATP-dependent DNA ligase [Paenibacillus hemerocallicola]TNJ63014.1 ATP-dependent DNA ligase [Paenibacillus hemerocallicola]